MATPEEKQAYVDEMVRKRGYVLDYHKVMAATISTSCKANGLVDAAYLKERRLDRKTKELIFIASLTAMREQTGHPESHTWPWISASPKRRSSRPSRSPCPRRGRRIPGRVRGLAEVVDAEGIEPTVDAHDSGAIRTGRTFLPQAIRTATPSNPSLAGGNRRMTSGSWPGTT